MFGQLKDLYNLQKQAKELQKQLENEKVAVSSSDNSVTITINGNHELLDIQIHNTDSKEALARAIKEAYAVAEAQLKSILAEKFKGMI
ncbi:MAG: hypothetical protein A3I07_03485 [Candidatus Doudnabacteria bacterium RIFCSPLOWO2_02_FULL_42_9]|uniref:Nucleoid-associated protein, YbaB/EbfC family n=1 Tax=Candidatus Doudnabacteria bacterium RIFCSPHIGHO2_01_FULL_41_86 TaxID=1817821 RepID=A0A1F5N8N2_9BACT|nr:MAG: hypothetical protein A2717_04650 [Candidatus Doudnabacteria bacterium RIFCSPHIGHO2_01_FULL_41_86]OGE86275.1 MAG: hypothetical protein A3E28_04005 [Candidatus Doudnabacteria bacterium RIFCSPHIGHO2_12_FULL_42_22]OGE87123.1 MAG: hypothetical protein A3C49_03670 [Candidatus Doudnabacteria bacterium RIFCSPHIGHO2_02_FULL_42_25]OGE92263.1 MAG: hypothetical protein A2895_04355 [Candidatus Doudnabacteria bacterium RIFCSPLOWO2_01_FULL_42_60]OGE99019.1 MAG: hypothetical protein A3G89_00195 [Candid